MGSIYQKENFNLSATSIEEIGANPGLGQRSAKFNLKKNLFSLSDHGTVLLSFHLLEWAQSACRSVSVERLCRASLENHCFKSYAFFRVFFHEKGMGHASYVSYERNFGESKGAIEISDYLAFLNQVEKSKSKFLSVERHHILWPHITGQELVAAKKVKEFSFIVVSGRNDSLPYPQEDVYIFNKYFDFIAPFLEKLLTQMTKVNVEGIVEQASMLMEEQGFKLEQKEKFTLTPQNFVPSFKEEFILREHETRLNFLGEMLNILKHELSNPFCGIELASTLLLGEKISRSHQEVIEHIKIYSKRCQDIIKNFSDFYTIKEVSDLGNLEKLIEELIVVVRSEARDIVLETQFASHNLDISFELNSTWLSQIIFNLMINAIEAMNEKDVQNTERKIIIGTKIDFEKYSLAIFVQDFGPGIKSEIRDKIFNAFFTTKRSGTGLGLHICSSLAKKLGGNLVLASEPQNMGTVFSVLLPLNGLQPKGLNKFEAIQG